MRCFIPLAALLSASVLSAQSLPFDASIRTGPQFYSYDIKAPFNEKVSEVAFPFFVVVPVLPSLTIDVGTAYAMARHERTTITGSTVSKTVSELSGLTDTQIRANYMFGRDFVVLTAGVNLPTGSATVEPEELEAAARIGSDFLTFPISGFGSGLGFTGGAAIARPVGNWNLGFGASMRRAGEFEPFKDATGTPVRFQPGAEYRARLGVDRGYGTGRMAFGFTFSKFGDDEAGTSVYNTGDRYITQFSINNAMGRGDYGIALWNLFRPGGTQADGTSDMFDVITNALVSYSIRTPGDLIVEPSFETRVWTPEQAKTSVLGTFGMRMHVNRGGWAIVPGGGFSVGTLEGATLSGFKATLGVRLGG